MTKKVNIVCFLVCVLSTHAFCYAFTVETYQIVSDERKAPGIIYRHYIKKGDEPVDLHLLEIDLRKIKIGFKLAQDEILGRETLSSMVKRSGAIGGVNGGFFEVNGNYQGDPLGFYLLSGEILSEPVSNNSSFGFCIENSNQKFFTEQFKMNIYLNIEGFERKKILGINRGRRSNDLVVFTPKFGSKTLTDEKGIEVLVSHGVVTGINLDIGSSTIPKGGFVISASGKYADMLKKNSKLKSPISFSSEIKSIRKPESKIDLSNCSFTTAGPTLVLDGKITPKFSNGDASTLVLHPRTAIGLKDDNTLIIVEVDGRQPELSVGMSLSELARFLKSQGVREGYNLDGGGSSTLVLKGKVLNHPSDLGGERAVGDSILFFSR